MQKQTVYDFDYNLLTTFIKLLAPEQAEAISELPSFP